MTSKDSQAVINSFLIGAYTGNVINQSGTNMMVVKGRLFSYRTLIAEVVEYNKVVAVNVTKYSNTTTKQVNYLLAHLDNLLLNVVKIDNVPKNFDGSLSERMGV